MGRHLCSSGGVTTWYHISVSCFLLHMAKTGLGTGGPSKISDQVIYSTVSWRCT